VNSKPGGLHGKTLLQKNKQPWVSEMAQVVERLSSKREAMSSNLSTEKKNQPSIQEMGD
jgi:hypothetical protein